MGSGNRFLRLHNFQVVCNAGGKSILRLRQRLLRQIDRTPRHFHLLRSCIQIEKRSPHLVVDAAT